ncbi:MAG: efflux RND transporter periplasmic adaptor subunit [Deltaproteobacteria bacterium]|nr:efflux RND transporter periplasmic adaptor subunit [Deltaproteobacteria bacterium]
MKASPFILIGCAAALFLSCGSKEDFSKTAPVPQKVKIEKVQASPVEDTYEAMGTVRSKTISVLSSKVLGRIVSIPVREGDRVKAGQLLVEIDDREMKAQLQKSQAGLKETQYALDEIEKAIHGGEAEKKAADARLALASSTLDRFKGLFERRSVSSQEFDEVQTKNTAAKADADQASERLQALLAKKNQIIARIDQAKADTANAEAFLSHTRILSPIDGIVTTKPADLGQMAAPGTHLLSVEDESHYRLEALVEESRISRIHLGDTVSVSIDALGQKPMAGQVSEIVPALDPASRSTIIKIDLRAPDSSTLFRSGLFGKARFNTGAKQVLTVPVQSVLERGQLTFVYVVDPAKIAHMRLIQTGKRYGDRVEILSGLSEGDQVVLEPLPAVKDGAAVEPGESS